MLWEYIETVLYLIFKRKLRKGVWKWAVLTQGWRARSFGLQLILHLQSSRLQEEFHKSQAVIPWWETATGWVPPVLNARCKSAVCRHGRVNKSSCQHTDGRLGHWIVRPCKVHPKRNRARSAHGRCCTKLTQNSCVVFWSNIDRALVDFLRDLLQPQPHWCRHHRAKPVEVSSHSCDCCRTAYERHSSSHSCDSCSAATGKHSIRTKGCTATRCCCCCCCCHCRCRRLCCNRKVASIDRCWQQVHV